MLLRVFLGIQTTIYFGLSSSNLLPFLTIVFSAPMSSTKERTFQQVQATQRKAVRFAEDVLQDDDLADELFDMSVEDYAARKRFSISNPVVVRPTSSLANAAIHTRRKLTKMASTVTKKELEDTLDQAGEIITSMLDPALTRVDLVSYAQDLDALVNGTEYEEEDDDEDSGEEDDDDEEEQ